MTDPRPGSRTMRAGALALLAAAALAGAQEEPPADAFGERIDVEVVEIDVVVTDRAGRHLTDLRFEEFVVEVDGEPVDIAYFSAPRPDAEPPAAAAPRAPGDPAPPAPPATTTTAEEPPAPSTLIVFVDQAALRASDRKRALAEIREFLGRRPPGETVAIAAFEQRLRLLAPPSDDPAAIDRAIEALEELPISAELAQLQGRDLSNRVRGTQVGWYRTAGPDDGEDSGVGETPGRQAERQSLADYWEQHGSAMEYEIRMWSTLETDRYRRSIASLTQLVGALGALDGRKSVVLVTGGHTTESGEALIGLLGVQRGNPAANRLAADHEGRRALREEFEAMVRAAQDARVALYTVTASDPSMLVNSAELASPGRDTLASQPRDPAIADAAASVARMAGATGGAVLLLGSDLDQRLERVRSDAEATYSLGIATGPEAGTADHRIEVRVAREGALVRHRQSFRRRAPGERAEQALYAAAAFGEEANPLGVTIELGEPRPAGEEREDRDDRLLPLAVRVPIGSLLLADVGAGARRARIGFRIALESESGELFVAAQQSVPIAIPAAELERARAGVWVHRTEVRVPPGTRQVALLVVDEVGGASATLVVPLPPA